MFICSLRPENEEGFSAIRRGPGAVRDAATVAAGWRKGPVELNR